MKPVFENGYYVSKHENEVSVKKSLSFVKGVFQKSASKNKQFFYKPDPIEKSSVNLKLQWLGHSSFLIQFADINILIDPVFSDIYPMLKKFNCYKRYFAKDITVELLPKIDVILISHNHFDHMDEKALLYFKQYQPCILVPKNLKSWFEKRGFLNVMEHDWWQSSIAKNKAQTCKFTATPALHDSMRRDNIDKNVSLWCGWVININDKNIYFAGDTAFDEEMFFQIKKYFVQIDTALLPIAPTNKIERHMDPLQALSACIILKPNMMIPMHWGTYRFSNEKLERPILILNEYLNSYPQLLSEIKLLKIGQSCFIK